MAISVQSPSCKVGFIKNATSADASGCEEIIAAVTGKRIKLRHVTINSTGAITITLGAGETGGAVTAALLGPVAFAANSTLQWDFNPNMVLPVATALTVDSSGAGNILVFVQGVIE